MRLAARAAAERGGLIPLAALPTWLAHSSLAIVLLTMSLAGFGVLPPISACALVLGANLGGALPAINATPYAEPPAGAGSATCGSGWPASPSRGR